MHDLLHERTAHLAKLSTWLRNGLQATKAAIPVINQHLGELAAVLDALMQDIRLLGS